MGFCDKISVYAKSHPRADRNTQLTSTQELVRIHNMCGYNHLDHFPSIHTTPSHSTHPRPHHHCPQFISGIYPDNLDQTEICKLFQCYKTLLLLVTYSCSLLWRTQVPTSIHQFGAKSGIILHNLELL